MQNALGTGLRLGEQLQMKRHQVDFLRTIVTARNTKNERPRNIPMNGDTLDTRSLISAESGLTIMCSSVKTPAHAFAR